MASISWKGVLCFQISCPRLEEMDELMCMVVSQAAPQTVYLLPSRMIMHMPFHARQP